MKPSQAIAGARILLNDPDEDTPRWSQAVLLAYFNDGMKALAKARGDLFQELETITLVDGDLQSVSRATTFGLTGVLKNSKNDSVRLIDLISMELQARGWRKTTRAPIQVWAPMKSDPFRFHCWPPATVGDTATVLVTRVPTDVLIDDIEIDNGVSDAYRAAAENYIAGRALTINTNAADTAKGTALLQLAQNLTTG